MGGEQTTVIIHQGKCSKTDIRTIHFIPFLKPLPPGFSSLEGMNGVQKFQIHRDDRSTDRLPSAHTCFNQLDLPVYETYDKLRKMLLLSITECPEGFGLAQRTFSNQLINYQVSISYYPGIQNLLLSSQRINSKLTKLCQCRLLFHNICRSFNLFSLLWDQSMLS